MFDFSSASKTMRVLHLTSGNLFGGIETMLLTLDRQAPCCPQMQPAFAACFEGRLTQELREAGAPVWMLGEVRTSRPWTVVRARRKLSEVLIQERFDVVLAHGSWPHAIFAPAARKAGLPVVFWAHGPMAGQHWLERWARRTRPDLVIANSHFTAASLSTLWSAIPMEVVYCPVAAPVAGAPRAVRREVRERMEVSEDALVILQASRMEAWKGHTLLLQALERLGDLTQWVCWIAGGAQRPAEARYLKELQAEAKRRKINARVRFLGQRSDVPQLLAASDILCQPNLGPEPFGIAFIEALYAGRPVVTTALGGALEIVNADCGILVPPENVPALADSLRALLTDPSKRGNLGAAGPARARALCAPQCALDQLYGLIAKLSQISPRRRGDAENGMQ